MKVKSYKFVPKEWKNRYSKTWNLTQRLLFDHKNKTVFIRGIWIDKEKQKSVRYRVLNDGTQEEFNIVGEIPEIPTFRGSIRGLNNARQNKAQIRWRCWKPLV